MNEKNHYLLKPSAIAAGLLFGLVCSTSQAVSIPGTKSSTKLVDAQPVEIPNTAEMPKPEQVRSSMLPPVFVVTPVVRRDVRDPALESAVTGKLEQYLAASSFKLVDRSLAQRLSTELLAAEASGKYNPRGVLAADYAVMTTIQEVGASASYKAPIVVSATVKTDPKCEYQGSATLYVRAYRLPSMEQVASTEIKGSASQSEPTTSTACEVPRNLVTGLYHAAAAAAVDSELSEFLNHFPPIGYVVERRDLRSGRDALFRVTMGTGRGVSQGMKAKFIRQETRFNDMTGKSETMTTIVAEGTVTELVDAEGSWVRVRNAEQLARVQRGDKVTMEFECKPGTKRIWGGICVPT